MQTGSAQPSRYGGPVGTTRTVKVHVSCPDGQVISADAYRSIDVSKNPELGQKLQADDPARALNTVVPPGGGTPIGIDCPVVYHDPDNLLFALVLPEGMRTHEIGERARLLTEIAADTAHSIPAYVRDFAVVYGASGLKRYLEVQAERALEASREAERETDVRRHEEDLRRREEELKERQVELERLAVDVEESSQRREAELDNREAAVERREAELTALDKALATRIRDLERREAESGDATRSRAATVASSPRGRGDSASEEANTAPFSPVELDELEEVHSPTTDRNAGRAGKLARGPARVAAASRTDAGDHDVESAAGSAASSAARSEDSYESIEVEPEPLADGEIIVTDLDEDAGAAERPTPEVGLDGATVVGASHDVIVERWRASKEPMLKAVDGAGRARLAVSAAPKVLSQVLGDRVAVRVQLHRMPTYPLIALVVGSPASLEGAPGEPTPVAFVFNVGDHGDRAVLDALAEQFTFIIDLYDRDYMLVRKRSISGGFAEMVADAAREAADALALVEPDKRSFNQACVALTDPSYDRYGWSHPDRREFREDKFRQVGTPQQVRRALAIARHFSAPEREAYLLWILGYPRRLWLEGRHRVIERAVAFGLWPGARLAAIAIRDGAARSHRELIARLKDGFAALIANPDSNDLDGDAVRDNWSALRREASAVGVDTSDVLTSAPRSYAIASDGDPAVSGVITGTGERRAAPPAEPERALEPAELVELLDSTERRLGAALELARRGEAGAVGAIFGALLRMTRGEAVQVLGSAISFGPAAVPYLIEGLGSRKAFLRQGCALALAVLGTEDAVEAITDALVTEPTDVWREIARGLGEVGQGAVMPLASRLRRCPEKARDRIAWALAHVAARGHGGPIEQLAGGRDPVAQAVARQAMSLVDTARRESVQIRTGGPAAEQTVNRAFSRDFFEALESATGPGAPRGAAERAEISGPHMLLDESDLIEAQEIEEI